MIPDRAHRKSTIHLRLLTESPQFEVAGTAERGAGRRLALLAYLYLSQEPVTRDRICELLWDPQPGTDSLHRLRELLSDTRRLLPPDVLITNGRFVAVDRTRVTCDVTEFRQAVSEGRLFDAANLYQAAFMSDCAPRGATMFREWADEFARQMQREFVHLLITLVESSAQTQDHETAARWAERLWFTEPDSVRYATLYVETQVAAGRFTEARAAAAAVESHFHEYQLELPRNLQKVIATAHTIRPISSILPAPLEETDSNKTAEQPGIGARPENVGRRFLRAGITLTAALAIIFAVISRSPAISKSMRSFGGAGFLVFKTPNGTWKAIRFDGPTAYDTVAYEPSHLDSLWVWQDLASPDRSMLIYDCNVPGKDDREVCIRSLLANDTRVVTGYRGDNHGLGWAPDQSWILVQSGRNVRGRHFNYDVYAVNARSGSSIRLTNDNYLSEALWAPDGTRIALTERRQNANTITIRTVDGVEVARHVFIADVHVRWSFDGQRLLVLEGFGSKARLFLITNADKKQIQVPVEVIHGATWSPDSKVLAVIGGRSREPSEVIFCGVEDCSQPLGRIKNASHALWIPSKQSPYVRRVQLSAETTRMAVGERLRLVIRTTDQNGDVIRSPVMRIHALDTTALIVDSLLTVYALQPGRFKIVATAGGWRADTLAIDVAAPKSTNLFRETWEGGLDTVRWKKWGDPAPFVDLHHGNRVFRNNGDDYYPSGVVTRQHISLAGGITLEWRQSTPLTGSYWQEVWIDLKEATPNDFRAGKGDPFPRVPAAVEIRAPIPVYHPRNPKLYAACQTDNRGWSDIENYPERLSDSNWHNFVFQLHADGRCELFIDGSLFVAHDQPRPINPNKRYVLSVGGRSYKTDILIDDVSFWHGIRWARTPTGRARLFTAGPAK